MHHDMFLGRERVRWPLLSNRAMRRLAKEHLDVPRDRRGEPGELNLSLGWAAYRV